MIQIAVKVVPKGPINNDCALVVIVDWRGTGHTPLSERMVAQFTYAYIHHLVSMNWLNGPIPVGEKLQANTGARLSRVSSPQRLVIYGLINEHRKLTNGWPRSFHATYYDVTVDFS